MVTLTFLSRRHFEPDEAEYECAFVVDEGLDDFENGEEDGGGDASILQV